MSVTAVELPSLSTLLRLGRISNVPTIWTNVLAGSIIAGGAGYSKGVGLIAIAMTAFYVGGMYLNDFFDRAIDARDRPGRPIDAGKIRANSVMLIGFGLLAVGIALDPTLGTLKEMHVDVETKGEFTRGETVANRMGSNENNVLHGDHYEIEGVVELKPNARVCMASDADRFLNLFVSRIRGK